MYYHTLRNILWRTAATAIVATLLVTMTRTAAGQESDVEWDPLFYLKKDNPVELYVSLDELMVEDQLSGPRCA